MPASDFFTKASPKNLLTLIDLLSSTGLNKKHPELSRLTLKLKRAIGPGPELRKDELKEISRELSDKPANLKNLIEACIKIAEECDAPPHKETKKLCFKANHLTLVYQDPMNFLSKELVQDLQKAASEAHKNLMGKTGPGSDFHGWIDLPYAGCSDIIETAEQIRKNSDAVVFVGIGGSYLGAKAVISALLPENYNLIAKELGIPEIYFAGQNLSTKYHLELLKQLKGKRVTLVPISKSGTTTEPAVAFRMLKHELEKMKTPLNFVAITDKARGALKELADENGWKTFVIEDDVGGRYSLFSPVGLLPIAIAGIDVEAFMAGAKTMADLLKKSDKLDTNPAMAYAVARQAESLLGKDIEILSCWLPYLTQVTEWWKQLYGESEGKDGKGIFVASTTFTTDLHSVGQLIQSGKRNIFETFLTVDEVDSKLTVSKEVKDLDKLNYLSGKSPDYINQKAYEGTLEAHEFGEVPTMTIKLKKLNEESLGSLLYFWQYACGLSAYIQGVNPFNQPGVEEYKKRMFKLLGKA